MTAGIASFPVPPVVKQAVIGLPLEAAFARFTRDIGRWWPLASHSLSGDDAETVVLEEGVGGRLFERARDGREHLWGTVTQWEPPSTLAFTWHVGRTRDVAQLVELSFHFLDASSTAVTLVHSGWENLGAEAQAVRERYGGGWERVLLTCFVDLERRKG